jgi:hypothetical protein
MSTFYPQQLSLVRGYRAQQYCAECKRRRVLLPANVNSAKQLNCIDVSGLSACDIDVFKRKLSGANCTLNLDLKIQQEHDCGILFGIGFHRKFDGAGALAS